MRTKRLCMIRFIVLYPGNNGVRRFWESRDHEVMIIGDAQERSWSVFLNGSPMDDPHGSLEDVVLDLARRRGIQCVMDPGRRWADHGGGCMHLTA